MRRYALERLSDETAATMRPTSLAAVSRSHLTGGTRPIPGASWAGGSIVCCYSTPDAALTLRAGGVGARLDQRPIPPATIPDASGRELHRQRFNASEKFRADLRRRRASARRWRNLARQVRRRVCFALIDLRRLGHGAIYVVTAGQPDTTSDTTAPRGFQCALCPLWVISRHHALLGPCPLSPRKRTLSDATGMSALCQ